MSERDIRDGLRGKHEAHHEGKISQAGGSRDAAHGQDGGSARQTGTGAPPSLVQEALDDPPSADAVRQLEDVFGRPPRKKGQSASIRFDYDDVVQQSFPASDPPPPPG